MSHDSSSRWSRRAGTIAVMSLLSVTAATAVPSATPKVGWTRQFGTAAGDQLGGVAARPTGTFVAGTTGGAIPGQSWAGGNDPFVRRYTPTGSIVWTRQFGTAASDQARSVAVTSAAVYVVGNTGGDLSGPHAGGGDAYLRKYTSDGTHVWTRQFGSTGADLATSVVVSNESVFVAGQTTGTFPGQTSAGGYDLWVARYSHAGQQLWTHQFGTAGDDSNASAAPSPAGAFVVARVDGALPGQVAAGASDVVLRHYDVEGNVRWTRQFGTAGNDMPATLGASGSLVYVGGSAEGTLSSEPYAGTFDGFVRRYDIAGHLQWTRMIGTTMYDEVFAIAASPSAVHVVGGTAGGLGGQTNRGGFDGFLFRFTPAGDPVWLRQFGTSGTDYAVGVAASTAGVFTSGYTDGVLSGQASEGGYDAFIRQYVSHRPDGHIATSGSPFGGNDVYNTSGASQTRMAQISRGSSQTFLVRVANDGDTTDAVTVAGCGSTTRFAVRYRRGTTDITTKVVGGTYRVTGLAPAETVTLRATVTVAQAAPAGAIRTCPLTLTSVASPTLSDVVKAKVEAKA